MSIHPFSSGQPLATPRQVLLCAIVAGLGCAAAGVHAQAAVSPTPGLWFVWRADSPQAPTSPPSLTLCVDAAGARDPALLMGEAPGDASCTVRGTRRTDPLGLEATLTCPGGRIVTISSRGALGGTRVAHYATSKAAVVGLTRAMAMELRQQQIAVNSVAPGFTDTPMTRSAPSEMFAAWEALEPRGTAASPAEIAHAIAFFAAPQTTFITGQTLFVDGGKSLGGLPI